MLKSNEINESLEKKIRDSKLEDEIILHEKDKS